MADRYWVGGSGTWDSSNTSNWAATSGGAGGETVPTSSDNVYIDANSGGSSDIISVSYANCGNLNTTGFTGSLDSYLYLYGNATFVAANSDLSSFSIVCVGTASTITSGGKTINTVQVDGSAVDIADNLTVVTLNLITGSFTTNNHNVTATSYLNSITDSAFTLTLGSSTLTFTGFSINLSNPSLSISAGTSTLAISGSSFSSIAFGGTYPTLYNITVQTSSTVEKVFYGSFTCNDITLYKGSDANVQTYAFTQPIDVNGTFTANGDNERRINVFGYWGTNVQIWAAAVSASYVNFFRITGAGPASWSGTSFGDIAYNTNITFTSPKTVYFNYPAGGSVIQVGVPKFATSSGGATSSANNPLPQDTIIFQNTGLNTSATITFPVGFCLPNTDFSARTNAFNFYTDGMCITRSLTIPTSATITAAGEVRVLTNTSQTFSSNSKTITFYLNVYGYLLMGDAYNSTAFSGINLWYGSSLTSNYAITLTGRLSCDDPEYIQYNILSGNQSTVRIGTTAITAGSIILKNNNLLAISTFPVPAMIVTGNNTTVFDAGLSTSGMSPCTVNFTYAGGTGTRTIAGYCDKFNMNITGGSDTVIAPISVNDIDFTGFSGTANLSSYAYGNSYYGNVTLSSGLTIASNTGTVAFRGTVSSPATKTITTFNKTFGSYISVDTFGTVQLVGNLTVAATKYIQHTRGTITTNNYNVTCATYISSYGGDTRTLNLGSSTFTLTSTGNVWNVVATNYTLNAGTSEIVLSSTSTAARTFSGAGLTYNKLTIGGATGTSTTTITGSNVFGTIASTKLVAHTISITSGTTQTVGTWSVNGTAGNVVTLTSTGATNHTLISAGSTQIANYMSISKSTASPTATWYAVNSTDGGGNVNWTFGPPVSGNGLFFGSNF